jgi:YbbR domain-containing protein
MRDRVLANWPLKLLALVLAFAIWVSITGQDRTVRDVTVPLEVRFGADQMSEQVPPTGVTLRLEGPRSTIRKLDPLSVAVRVDLRNAPLGEREVPLSRSNVTGVGRDIDVSLMTPDRIRLSLVRRARRQLEVRPDLVGEPAAGHEVYGYRVTPRIVVAAGPESAIQAIEHLPTAAIPLEGRSGRFVVEVALVPEDPQVRAIDRESVEVEVLIDAAPVEVVVEDVPVEVPFLSADVVRARPAVVEVTLSGPPRRVERIEPAQVAAVAELEAPLPEGTVNVRVRGEVRLSAERRRWVTVKSIRPERVAIEVRESAKEGP